MKDINWKKKLTSRKFWMAIALFVSGVLTATGKGSQAEVITGLIMQGGAVVAYIIGEGFADSVNNIPEGIPMEVIDSDVEE